MKAVWTPVDETLPDIGPPYPDGSPSVALATGLHTLTAQQSQIQVLDLKNSLGATVVLAVVGLMSGVLVASQADALAPTELAVGAVGSACYLTAFVVFWRDWWVRTYLGAPGQSLVREQAGLADVTEHQLQWAAAVAIEQAIIVNDRHLVARIAAFKVIWILVPVGTALILGATAARLA